MSQWSADLPHAAELGAFVGNSGPVWSGPPGIRRQPQVMFENGNIETFSRVESCSDGYRLIDRDRSHESTAAKFSHVDDVERFIAIRDGSRRSSGLWFPGRATAPDAVTLQSDGGTSVFSGGNGRLAAMSSVSSSRSRISRLISRRSPTLAGGSTSSLVGTLQSRWVESS